jgi:GT2 family glycosyltransferase
VLAGTKSMAIDVLTYSVVVATGGREKALSETVCDWQNQWKKPEKIVVVDFKPGELFFSESVPVEVLKSPVASAAQQRNLGAKLVKTNWLVFSDDDVRFGPELATKVLEFIQKHQAAVAVTPRMRGSGHPKPGNWLRYYYDWQAGKTHPHHGARLFGPGISTYPCWEDEKGAVESNWLPSTLLWIRTEEFHKVKFPNFEGYSAGEDAYLTHRIWRKMQPKGKLYFLDRPEYDHFSIKSGIKLNRFALARMANRNQRRIAKEAMEMGWLELIIKSLVHRIFLTAALLRGGRKGAWGEIAGIWAG